MYKIIGADHKEYGPVTADQIRQWIAEGRVNAQTQVMVEGDPEWNPLSAFAEFGLFSAQTPPSVFTAPAAKPPGVIKVFGIINIVLGSLGLLCSPFSIFGIPLVAKQFGNQPIMTHWLYLSSFVSLVGAAILLTSGIGLCKYLSWARRLAVYYAIFACLFNLLGVVLVLASFSTNASMTDVQRISGMVGSVFGAVINLSYNILLLVFLTRRRVKIALGEIAQGNP